MAPVKLPDTGVGVPSAERVTPLEPKQHTHPAPRAVSCSGTCQVCFSAGKSSEQAQRKPGACTARSPPRTPASRHVPRALVSYLLFTTSPADGLHRVEVLVLEEDRLGPPLEREGPPTSRVKAHACLGEHGPPMGSSQSWVYPPHARATLPAPSITPLVLFHHLLHHPLLQAGAPPTEPNQLGQPVS